jgi:ferredoxin
MASVNAAVVAARAARAIQNRLLKALYGVHEPAPEPASALAVQDPEANTALIKQAARWLGADLVGVCQTDHRGHGPSNVTKAPEDLIWTVVLAVRMDRHLIAQSPRHEADLATRMGYVRMALCAPAVGECIRELGYRAISAGNEFCPSVPLAQAAGLGQMGRHGLLITAEFGPCIRLCKVFTNLPLRPDRPVEMGVEAYCRGCDACVKACPAQAIGSGTAPGEWSADGRKCRAYWERIGRCCSTCVAVCPFPNTVPGATSNP